MKVNANVRLVLRGSMLIFISLFGAACTSVGPIDSPLIRPFQYFSYLNGDDIRRSCVAGGPHKYRLVFNALYEQQVRTYDIEQNYNSRIGVQESRVFARGIGSEFSIGDDGIDFGHQNFSASPLTFHDLLALDSALIASGFEQAAKVGLLLHSDEFYWIAMVCRNGVFKYYAWTKEIVVIEELPFTALLSKADHTGVVSPPVKEPVIHNRGGRDQNSNDLESRSYFSLEVGVNGLKL